jgi:hypothetical protein
MKPAILIQLDTDPQPSVFDGVVAVDSGAEHLFRHGGVTPDRVRDLVYGGLFTRAPKDLKRTAVFVGGSDVSAGEAVFQAVRDTFFGPFKMSVMLDSNGANTTAAAAVVAALNAFDGKLDGVKAAVLGGTGPVGQRVARLLARQGAEVAVGSRKVDRAKEAARAIAAATGQSPTAFGAEGDDALREALEGRELVVAAGAPGATLLPGKVLDGLGALRVAIDLNAVPPAGIEGIERDDAGKARGKVACWGAIGVGGKKMDIHRRAIRELFESNDRVLDAEEIFALAVEE